MARTFVIDTDTASDDAVALIMALRDPDVEVAAITVVSGNVPVDQGVKNALYTAELCGVDVPVYRGADRPLVKPALFAHFFHGEDGLGDLGFVPRSPEPAAGHAADALVETLRANPGATLVTLGPLTNVAMALEKAPDIAGLVERCVVMGGAACTVGNVTPAAEYNIYVDPDAARTVFRSPMPIEMVGWELCRGEANLDQAEMDEVRAIDTPYAHFAIDCNRTAIQANFDMCRDPGLGLPDPVAMAVALDPDIATRKSVHYVDVEAESELTRGMTVVDELDVTGESRNHEVWGERRQTPPNVTVCWEIDVPAWKEALYRSLR